jgi:hypothetical protein
MPKKKSELDQLGETIDKLLVLELWERNVPQGKIAKAVSRSKSWVNDFLKVMPKGGQESGTKGKQAGQIKAK